MFIDAIMYNHIQFQVSFKLDINIYRLSKYVEQVYFHNDGNCKPYVRYSIGTVQSRYNMVSFLHDTFNVHP